MLHSTSYLSPMQSRSESWVELCRLQRQAWGTKRDLRGFPALCSSAI